MARRRALTLILAGGEGSRLELLTERRAKPALPYAGVYRLIDFPLSNCVHSGLEDVWVLVQYQPYALSDHLANGRPWDLDRTFGGLRLLPPQQGGPAPGAQESGFHQGNADAVHRNRRLIREYDPEVVVVLSADHVYTLDYGPVIRQHLEREAELTFVTTEVSREDAARLGVVEAGEDGRVTGFAYKADEPPTTLAATEVYVLDPTRLLDLLEELAREDERSGEGEPGALTDFGHGLLPRLVEGGRAFEYRLHGYWRDVGTVASYWQSHMELVGPDRSLDLDDRSWPILTQAPQREPARIAGTARFEEALVSPGTVLAGTVVRSVLGPGVVVEEGATVRDAVVLQDTVVGSGAVVAGAVVDRHARVGRGARVGQGADPEQIALVGEGAEVPDGGSVPAGGRLGRGEEADG